VVIVDRVQGVCHAILSSIFIFLVLPATECVVLVLDAFAELPVCIIQLTLWRTQENDLFENLHFILVVKRFQKWAWVAALRCSNLVAVATEATRPLRRQHIHFPTSGLWIVSHVERPSALFALKLKPLRAWCRLRDLVRVVVFGTPSSLSLGKPLLLILADNVNQPHVHFASALIFTCLVPFIHPHHQLHPLATHRQSSTYINIGQLLVLHIRSRLQPELLLDSLIFVAVSG